MREAPAAFSKPRVLSIRKHIEAKGDKEAFTTIADLLSHIHATSTRWQQEDWKRIEDDEADVLNPARIVGQVWFAPALAERSSRWPAEIPSAHPHRQ
jgi:hypothetical protein